MIIFLQIRSDIWSRVYCSHKNFILIDFKLKILVQNVYKVAKHRIFWKEIPANTLVSEPQKVKSIFIDKLKIPKMNTSIKCSVTVFIMLYFFLFY